MKQNSCISIKRDVVFAHPREKNTFCMYLLKGKVNLTPTPLTIRKLLCIMSLKPEIPPIIIVTRAQRPSDKLFASRYLQFYIMTLDNGISMQIVV